MQVNVGIDVSCAVLLSVHCASSLCSDLILLSYACMRYVYAGDIHKSAIRVCTARTS
jgi:hypothetical protein